jgi:hypothetical protein
MPAVLVPTRVPSRRSFTAPLNASHAEMQFRSVSTTSGRCSSGTSVSVRVAGQLPRTSQS